jgi:hypothetical protein
MRRVCRTAAFLALVLIPVPAAAQQPAQQAKPDSATAAAMAAAAKFLAQAQAEGQMAATGVGTGGWFGGGFASGLFLGLIGTGVSYALASSSSAELPPDKRLAIVSQPLAYQQSYEKGFADKVRSRRKGSALTGGLLGTATFLVIYLSAMSGNGY